MDEKQVVDSSITADEAVTAETAETTDKKSKSIKKKVDVGALQDKGKAAYKDTLNFLDKLFLPDVPKGLFIIQALFGLTILNGILSGKFLTLFLSILIGAVGIYGGIKLKGAVVTDSETETEEQE